MEVSLKKKSKPLGFTLIELLVVISIIALLVGILLPALGAARRTAQGLVSLSNVRQWGVASSSFTTDHRGLIARDGVDQIRFNLDDDEWWANALPPYVGHERYIDMDKTPLPGDGGIFVDDSAEVPSDVLTYGGYPTGHPVRTTSFFCYVPNSQLAEQLEIEAIQKGVALIDNDPTNWPRIREDQIWQTSKTVQMLEKRTIENEVESTDPFYKNNNGLNRAKANWKRVAARHRGGGHYLFADAHGEHVDFDVATTNKQGTRNDNEPGGDWNNDTLIWNPLGPALN